MGQNVRRDKGMLKRRRVLSFNKAGFTLIEVMVAFVILLIVMLGLLNLTAQVTTVNVKNAIRDEAIKVAEEIMAQQMALPFDSIISTDPAAISRKLRNFILTYDPKVDVTTYSDAKVINVTVTWEYKGTPYSHTITSLVRRTQ